jgi:hypothetical protein
MGLVVLAGEVAVGLVILAMNLENIWILESR